MSGITMSNENVDLLYRLNSDINAVFLWYRFIIVNSLYYKKIRWQEEVDVLQAQKSDVTIFQCVCVACARIYVFFYFSLCQEEYRDRYI